MVLLEQAVVVLEAVLVDCAPEVVVKNPFDDKRSKRVSLWPSSAKRNLHKNKQQHATAGKLVKVKSDDANSDGGTTYWLRFLDVQIRNDKNLPCFVLLSRSSARSLSDDASVKALEANAETVLLDDGPDGQWKGCHMVAAFDQELSVFDPLAFAAVALCKPSAAKPPSALPLVFAFGGFQSYTPPPKSAEQLALEMELLSAKLLGAVVEVEPEALQGDEQLSLDALQRSAKQLFKLFDQDRSNSIDFDEYRQMLAYRKINLMESKARRFFRLVDDQNKGFIDEREFVVALYITNYLRLHHAPTASGTGADRQPPLSPIDVFHQLDADRDELLNVFEFEKALELLGVACVTPADAARARRHFPTNASGVSVAQFTAAWLQLADVKSELTKRGVPTERTSDATVQRNDSTTTTTTATTASTLSPLSLVRGKRTNGELDRLRAVLLDHITREEQAELQAARQAKDEVVRLERARRDAEQDAKRQLYNQHRHAATATRTVEALRERQDKIARKKERAVKERQAKQERRLLAQLAHDARQRNTHQLQAVQEHMAAKIDVIARLKARNGDDALDLRGHGLDALPASLYHGRDALRTLSSLLILDVSHNRLRALPGALFSYLVALQALDASSNELTALPAEVGDARDLQTLDLHSNRLEAVPDELRRLRRLTVLELAGNQLQTFGACCDGLDALEELNLSSNRLTALAESVGRLPALQRLRLRGNPALKVLPASLQQLGALVAWDLSACELKRLPAELLGPRLASLRSLNLAHNALSSLPVGVGTLAALQELTVAHNLLVHLPAPLGDLHELIVLDASSNRLEVLPDGLCGLCGLEILGLARNRLVSLPPTLGLLAGLRRLELQHNRLQSVPLELGALEHLTALDVSWNELTALPEELGCLAALRALNVSHNRLAQLPASIALWQRLETLRCTHNALATPLTTSLGALQGLQYLDLSHNELAQLEACVYELAGLEVLRLAANRLASLPAQLATAACSASLRTLDVSHNRLAALPVELAQLLPRLEVFAAERNPLKLLPDKWSSRWRLEDQYATSFARGYAPAEAVDWVRDQSVCYPAIVRVWEQLTALSPRGGDGDDAPVERTASPRPAAGVGSDEFLRRVRAAMGDGDSDSDGGAWEPRFERVVRYFFYEFKHLGHAVAFADVPVAQREQLDAAERELVAVRQQRAAAAIADSDAFRARRERAYSCVDRESVAARALDRRRAHERTLLSALRRETQQLNAVVEAQSALSLVAREQRRTQQRAQFAVEMKRVARERLAQRQQLRDNNDNNDNDNHHHRSGASDRTQVVE
ncbi:hypothetical protein PybrP1_006292 [[Pythium] brassicae (nom. inval.)]|nr:hypothetical protein PybrP1_006292 [[Pythium] brassicae (nom. inval.)]